MNDTSKTMRELLKGEGDDWSKPSYFILEHTLFFTKSHLPHFYDFSYFIALLLALYGFTTLLLASREGGLLAKVRVVF